MEGFAGNGLTAVLFSDDSSILMEMPIGNIGRSPMKVDDILFRVWLLMTTIAGVIVIWEIMHVKC
jgi:hypothetical protein